jgi:Zn-dependent M28 family amino/carboxypeptidase
MILMDMVGDRDLLIQIPRGHPDLNNRMFDVSTALGYRNHFRSSPYPIIDDHLPFVLEGVPAINLMDFHFGPENSWWHTEKDSLENICPESLAIVGKTVLGIIESYGKK